MQDRRNVDRFVGAAIALCATTAWAGSPTGTAFTYQGQLKQNGVPISDTCAFEFSLWDSADKPHPAGQVGATLVFDGPGAIEVVDGLFTAPLDFGDGAYNGDDRWLEVAVKCSTSLDYTTLTPRQPVTAAPFASFADQAPWDGLVGVPPDIADGDSDTQLSEAQVEDYLTNGPVDFALGTTMSGLSIATGSHTVDTNAGTLCSGAGVFLDGEGNCVPGGDGHSLDASDGDPTDAIYVDEEGRVGIGDLDPTHRLTVGGAVRARQGGFIFPDGSVQTTAWSSSPSGIFYPAGFVGLGTNNPTMHLDIWSDRQSFTGLNIANSTVDQRFFFQVNGSYLTDEGRAGNLEIWSVTPKGSTNVYTATPDGNVGIGVTTPDERLAVVGRIESTSGGFVFPDGTVQTTAAVGPASPWIPNGPAIYYNSGHVGIGTDNPAARLSVNSANTDITGLTLSNTSTDRTVVFQVNGSNHTGSGRAGNFEIWTGDSTSSHNVFTATPDGKVGIGKTTVGTVHNATALEVAHGSIALDNGYGIFSTNSAGTGTGAGLHMSSRDELYLMAGGRVAMVIDPSYNVGISAPEPDCRLDVGGVARVKGDAWPTDGKGMELAYNQTYHRGFIQVYDRQTDTWGDLFLGNGKVGIGTLSLTYPLQVGTNSTNGNGAHVTAGGVWTNGSDRHSKRNVRPIDRQSLLAKVLELPVTQWQYKGEPDDVEHIGPMAQDFYAAFELGDSDKYIGTVDADGVALAAIQGLHEQLAEKDKKIEAQQGQIAELTARLEQLEAVTAELAFQMQARRP